MSPRNDRNNDDPTAVPGSPRAAQPQGSSANATPEAETGAGASRQGSSDSVQGNEGAQQGTAQSLLPALTVPTGGGAIRGIGEKFEVNAATGTASVSVPLPTSPARGGQGPQVSLSYSSGGGNGPFGLGFSLSVPMITRKTDKGIPRYLDDAETDTYVLSGAEDLVPMLDASGAPVFVEYDASFAPVTPGSGTYRAYRYRPRIEGLFARIERWVVVAPGQPRDVHWRVTTPDNNTFIYGFDPQNRVADPEHPSHVFTWLLEETRDDKGNIVRYEYKAEDGDGVDPTRPSERSRFDFDGTASSFRATAQRYLKRVLYCNAAPNVASDFLMELVFDYGEHAAATSSSVPEPDVEAQAWPVRTDPFSTHRSGFEVRTYRLCRRVLMFHRLNATRDPLFVRATEFGYDETSPAFTYLTSVVQAGFLFDSVSSTWQRQEMPRLDLDYQRPQINDHLEVLPEESREGLQGGTDGARKQWVDLDGEGIPGVLIDQGGAWFYKENRGSGQLAAPRRLHTQPSPGVLAGGTQKLEDIDGDGRLELVAFEPNLTGYFTRTHDGDFDPLRPFQSVPNVNWDDPNLRMIDLDGDGHADLLITEDCAFVWYRSKARDGYEPSQRVAVPFDEDQGPRVVFANSEQSIQLADMSGDGLVDIVRIRNGEVSYWPNLGYGRFGRKITLENSPVFTTPDEFHASRVRFGDLDGSGTSDLVYLSSQGTHLYFNQAGNSLSDVSVIHALPPADKVTQISITDLFGTGTSCLVWSSPLAEPTQTVLYVDVMASQKPHLLNTLSNNLGATTTLTYASSTKFYLEDKRAGTPWLTRLPFPVQVVEKVETQDAISGGKLTSHYRYAHGFFDGEEREFRGFARVEQTDAEDFADPDQDPLLYQPPVRTVSWFHTGAWLEKERLELALQSEYYPLSVDPDGPPPLAVPDTILPPGMRVQDEREAARALKGNPLRTEVYADDGDIDKQDIPFVITETNHQVRLLQPSRGPDRYGVFFTHPRETVTITTERNPSDPRVAHEFILQVDDYGAVTRQASLVYARATGHDEQRTPYATLTETDVAHQDNPTGTWRIGTQYEQRTYELTGIETGGFTLPNAGDGLTDYETFRTHVENPAADIAYEATPSGTQLERRLIERNQQTFYDDTLTTEAALGTIGARALPYQTYQLALTPGLVAQIVSDSGALTSSPLDPALLVTEGGYALRDSAHWTQSGRVQFDPSQFYLPEQAHDPFGNPPATITWDTFALLPVSTTDPLGNTSSAQNDYRVLSPEIVTDINDNQTQVTFDALGMLIATAVMGKAGGGDGDTITDPTTRLEYDLLAYQNNLGPAYVKTIAREVHGPTNTKFQTSYTYSDGFGRVVQQKVQAEPGDAPQRDSGTGEIVRNPDGTPVLVHTDPRWVGTGRTLYNNKGNPVKQWEPYFSDTETYEDDDDLVQWGVTPIITYDSIDRVVRTDLPDGTYTKVEFDSWEQRTYDQNDTVTDSQWYADISPPPPGGAEPSDPLERAAWLASQHDDTPTTAYLDSLGRPFLSEADNNDTSPYQTRTDLDIEGNPLAIYDARQIDRNPTTPVATIRQTYDVLGRRIKVVSADAGTRLTLQDTAGKPLRSWNTRGFTSRSQYDAGQRPTHAYVAKGGTEDLVARISYGESITSVDPKTLNLRGQAHLAFDGAGLVKTNEIDFKGNVLSASRRLATAYTQTPTWNNLAALTDPDDLETNAAIETETFTTTTQYDALNRVVQSTAPDGSTTTPEYNEANLLERLTVDPKGTGARVVVANVEYNARGQRLFCEHAENSGTPSHTTTYEYDPKTFRVTRIRTLTSTSTVLQDLQYTHDPVGNITEMTDAATWDTTLASQNPTRKYVYDALYRLASATGREHAGQQPTDEEPPYRAIPHGNDLYDNLRAYTEELTYDRVGNITQMRHLTGPSNSESWSRNYDYEDDNNRLVATSVPGDPSGTYSATYEYNGTSPNDAGLHGSVTRMPHLDVLEWDYVDRLYHTDKSTGSNQHTYFTYDAGGMRVRKVYEHNGIVEERIYLGGFEVYRRHDSGAIGPNPELERETLHVMDDTRRVAMVETKTRDTVPYEPSITEDQPRWRYQLDDHLGSSAMEITDTATVISYEEYHPYGSTAFHSAEGAYVSAKRYRYTGKEKDDETGLYYHGARYYAPWLGRWTSADPAGVVDGLNLYRYSRDNPIGYVDPGGTQSQNVNTLDPQDPANFVDFESYRAANPDQPVEVVREVWGDAHHETPASGATSSTPPAATGGTDAAEPSGGAGGGASTATEQPQATNPWVVRGVAALQLGGGVLEVLGGVGLLLVPEPTFATKAGGVVLVGHGADTTVAGFRTLVSGEIAESFTQQGAEQLALAAGADEGTASGVGTAVDITAGVGPNVVVGLGRRFAIAGADESAEALTLAFLNRGATETGHNIVGITQSGTTVWYDLRLLSRQPGAAAFAPLADAPDARYILTPLASNAAATSRATAAAGELTAQGAVRYGYVCGPNCTTTALTVLQEGGVAVPAWGRSPALLHLGVNYGYEIGAVGAAGATIAPPVAHERRDR